METSHDSALNAPDAVSLASPTAPPLASLALPSELQAVLDRLQGGESLQAIELSLLPDNERELLRLCALVRVFDAKLVDVALRPLVSQTGEALPFQTIISREDVEAVPRREGTYRFNTHARQRYLETWWEGMGTHAPSPEVPSALRAASRVLVDYYRQQDGMQSEVLYHLVAVSGAEASQLFEELYAEADSRLDLARCQDVLELLEERRSLLGSALKARLEDRQSYRRARELWALAYDQSFYFYERRKPKARLEALLQDQKFWILQMHARGGMGKTSFVRWILGRFCSPEPLRIPCARLDFDEFDPVTLSQHSWHLFYLIADQLNEQLPGSTVNGTFQGVLSGFLSSLHEFAVPFQKQSTLTSRSPEESPSGISDNHRKELNLRTPTRFADALSAVWQDRPVLILIDTLEELLLRPGTDLMAIVRSLAQVKTSCSGLRLILSGRYQATDLRHNGVPRVPGFSEEFADAVHPISLNIQPFSRREAREFLQQKRGLAPEQHINTIIARAHGNPLKLSLYADIVRDDPSVTAQEFEQHDPDLVYFIQRVVGRIPQLQVRWVLRYGALPRRLTRAFLEDVMAPHLKEALAMNFQDDDPTQGLKGFTKEADRHAFLTAQSVEVLSLDQLWDAVGEYTSLYGWVSRAGGSRDTFVFHDDVVHPMRRLLQEQPIARRLHRDAVAHYEARASAEPEHWTKWIREAIYHTFQGESSVTAASYWRRQLRAQVVQNNPAWRRDLANEVLGPEYIFDDEPRQRFDGSLLIDRSTIIEACFEAAQAYAGMTRTESVSDAEWNLAESALARAEELERRWGVDELPSEGVAALKAQFLVARRNFSGALQALETFFAVTILSALALPMSSLSSLVDNANPERLWQGYAQLGGGEPNSVRDRITLQTQYAEALAHNGRRDEANEHYQQVLRLVAQTDEADEMQWEIRLKLARYYAIMGNFVEAAQQYEVLIALSPPTPTADIELTRNSAETFFALGQWERARTLCDARLRAQDAVAVFSDSVSVPGDRAVSLALASLHLLHARILLAWRDPLGAVTTLTTAQQHLGRIKEKETGVALALRAECHEVEGLAWVQTCEFDRALNAWNQASEFYQVGGQIANGNRCLLHRAELQLRELGQRHEAYSLMQSASRFLQDEDTEGNARVLLVVAEANLRVGATAAARVAGEQALSAVQDGQPQLQARVAAQTLALFGAEMAESCLPRLVEALRQVEPREARLLLLDAFSRWVAAPWLEPEQAALFLDSVSAPTEGTAEFLSLALLFADVARVAQRPDEGQAILESAGKTFRLAPPSTVPDWLRVKDWLRAKDRIGWSGEDPSQWSMQLDASLASLVPIARGAALLEHAERLVSALNAGIVSTDVDLNEMLQEVHETLKFAPLNMPFMARLALVRARFAAQRGDRIERDDYAAEAERLYRQLDDQDALRLLQTLRVEDGNADSTQPREVFAANSSPISVIESAREVNVVRISMVGPLTSDGAGRSEVHIESSVGGEITTRLVSTDDEPTLNSLLNVSSSDFYSYEFLKQMDGDQSGAGEMMGRLLFTEAERHQLTSLAEPDNATDLRLEIDHPLLQPIPWELMRLDASIPSELPHPLRTRHVFRGPLRPAPREYLSFGKDGWFEEERQILAFHSFHGRYEAFRQYRQDFYIDDMPLDKVPSGKDPTIGLQPDILYITAMLNESQSLGGTYLDSFSSPRRMEQSGMESRGMSVQRLIDFLREIHDLRRKRNYRPVVILDVPLPQTRLDALRQVFLRNHFAAALFDSSLVEAVIGIGDEEDRGRMRSPKLLDVIAAEGTLGEAVGAVRRSGSEWSSSTALFAYDPTFRIEKPRRP